VNVVLRLREEDVRRADDLQNLVLGDARGQTVGTLAGFTLARRPTAIERENRRRGSASAARTKARTSARPRA